MPLMDAAIEMRKKKKKTHTQTPKMSRDKTERNQEVQKNKTIKLATRTEDKGLNMDTGNHPDGHNLDRKDQQRNIKPDTTMVR